MPASGLLALVQPDLPRSPEGLRALAEQDPKLHGHLGRLSALCDEISRLTETEQRRAFIRSLLTATGPETSDHDLYGEFAKCLATIQISTMRLCEAYMTDHYFQEIFATLLGVDHRETTDPLTLFCTGFQSKPEDWHPSVQGVRVAFESRRDLMLALLYWELKHTKRIGRRQARKDREKVNSFLLHHRIIVRPAEPVYVHSLHDPKRVMRTSWVEHFHDHSPAEIERLVQRSTKLHLTELCLKGGRTIPVAVEVRRKGLLQIVGKWLVVQGTGVQQVEDRRGLRFVYATVKEMQEGAEFIRGLLPLTDFMTSDEMYRDTTDPGAPPLSRFVPFNLPSVTYFRPVLGHRTQVQHFPVAAHLDLICSRGPENHSIYHLRQYTADNLSNPQAIPKQEKSPGLFYWMFPPKIYGIQWNNPTVFEELVHHVLARLPT